MKLVRFFKCVGLAVLCKGPRALAGLVPFGELLWDISEELTKLDRNLGLLATTASVAPFIGLFGTVIGIIRTFNELSQAGSATLRAVGPGISDALLATAVGLAAAIPAAMAYNYFGHMLKEIGARMDDFLIEFLNMTERNFEE